MARSGSGAVVPRAASRRAQRGIALMALLAVAVMAVAYVLTSRLNAASQFIGIDREHNAKVLNRAKQALIGYVAQQASLPGESNPGRLPCPEAGAYFGDPTQEGIAAPNCTLPAVGRLPWRTLGLEQLVDADAEPLWYVVSPGWALSNSTVPPLQTLINSDSIGQLAVDGAANDSVALIIAPGLVVNVQAGGGCLAGMQSRPVVGPPDVCNYLEGENATSPPDATFVTSTPSSTFNDQVVRVTAADIIPALEAAIAHRMAREIVPALRNVYAAPNWGLLGTSRVFPYAAPFDDPAAADYVGVAAQTQGLLPFYNSLGCPSPLDPRCVGWSTTVPTVTLDGTNVFPCTFTPPSTPPFAVECTGTYVALGPIQLRFDGVVNNVAMALRTLDPSKITVEYRRVLLAWASAAAAVSGTLRTDGHANIRADATIPGLLGLSYEFRVKADLGVVADHPLLDASSTAPGSTGWFARNEWFRLTHYAVSVKNTASNLPNSCAGANCLRIDFPASTQNDIRALLVLAGRSINGTARPSAAPADYLEFDNNDGDRIYEQNPISRVLNAAKAPFNDRVLVVDTN